MFVQRPPPDQQNAVRGPADSFDDARPDETIAGRRSASGQFPFAGLTSSGWLDQAPLVALRIEEDLEGAGSVPVDAAYPLGTKGLRLPRSFSDV